LSLLRFAQPKFQFAQRSTPMYTQADFSVPQAAPAASKTPLILGAAALAALLLLR